MKRPANLLILIVLFLSFTSYVIAQEIKPVNPNATPEAVELLNYIYSLSGKHTLSGQQNEPMFGSIKLQAWHKHLGIYPAVFGQDFGFSPPGTWDGINYRQQIVDEAIRRHEEGFIVTLMWHAVRPTEEEPVEFRESIQGELSEQEWKDLITPGTWVNEKWKSQVDVIAFFLKQLKNADVPVLWRPYHEMNGAWFWWGDKKGDDGYKKLYRMMYDRLVNFHGLNNLIWVFNGNEVKNGVGPYADYYPGDDVVDILATDVYSENYNQLNYDQLSKLAGSKPIALGEVGSLPSLEIIQSQPKWTWFMHWFDPMEIQKDGKKAMPMLNSENVLNHAELPWVEVKDPKIHTPVLK